MEKDLFFVEEVRTKTVLIMGSFDWCFKWICENCKIEHGCFIDDDNEAIDLHVVTDYEIN